MKAVRAIDNYTFGEVKEMKKLTRILMILGSLIGIAATVRW